MSIVLSPRNPELEKRLATEQRYKADLICIDPITSLGLPVRVKNVLMRAGIETVGQLVMLADSGWIDTPLYAASDGLGQSPLWNFGEKAKSETTRRLVDGGWRKVTK